VSSISDTRGALTRGFTGYFDFKGSATRRDYWTWTIAVILINSSFSQLAPFLIIPTLSYGARRMHDVGQSAWWLLIFPVAFYFALQPSKAPTRIGSATSSSDAPLSKFVSELQEFTKVIPTKLKVFISKSKPKATKSGGSDLGLRSDSLPKAASEPSPATTSLPSKVETSKESIQTEPVRFSDSENFMKLANGLGLVTANEDSVVAVTQSLIRQIWSKIRSQQEPDHTHTDHLRLAIRALAEVALTDSKSPIEKTTERAKSAMWYGIILAMISVDDLPPSTLGESVRLSPSEALRKSRLLFEGVGDQKMAARCMEELGQYGRLIQKHDLMTEGFDESVRLFNLSGAPDRAKQASTNSGVNFQRHSSAFFDGGQHSLKATTILGSSQGERLRNSLHHVD